MTGAVFFDTNVLVYAALNAEPRSAVARALLAAGGMTSVQVLNEFASVAQRKFKRSWPEIAGALADFRRVLGDPLPTTASTHEAALAIAARDGLAFYDSLTVAAALEAGCSTLLSEDMQHGRTVARKLMIRNPFLAA